MNNSFNPIRILMIEDSELSKLTKQTLKRHFKIVEITTSGEEALNLYKELKPDIVTISTHLPQYMMEENILVRKLNYLETIRELVKEFPKSKIVAIGHYNKIEDIEDCIQAGAKDFIVKPFKSERLVESIHKAINE